MKKSTPKKSVAKTSTPEKIVPKNSPAEEDRADCIRRLCDYLPSVVREPIYSREETAPIAARLLEGDDFPRAVQRATKLLAECDKQRREAEKTNCKLDNVLAPAWAELKKVHSLSLQESKRLPTSEKWKHGLPMPLIEAFKCVTSQSRADRALEAVLALIERREGGLTPAQRTQWAVHLDKMKAFKIQNLDRYAPSLD